MGDIAKIELSKDLIAPIVQAQLQASITAALGRADDLVASVVQSVMNMQVDSHGNKNSYGGNTLISWMAEKAIKEAAMDALKEWFAENREKIKVSLRKEIERNSKGMAEQFVLGLTKSVESSFYSTIKIEIVNK